MGRFVKNPLGGDAAYSVDAGQDVYDFPLDDLPPLTRAIRESWGPHTAHPVASAAAVAALFQAVFELETRLIALGG